MTIETGVIKTRELTKEEIEKLKDYFRIECDKLKIAWRSQMHLFRHHVERSQHKDYESAKERVDYVILVLKSRKTEELGKKQKLGKQKPTKKEEEIPKHIQNKALELARDPKLLYETNMVLGIDVVGEGNTRLLVFCLGGSSKTKYKQIIVIKGASSVGKNWLIDKIIGQYYKVRKRGRFTPHALEYSDLQPDEILYIQQLFFSETTGTMRLISTSDGGFILEHYAKDEEGNPTTETKKIPAVTLVTTTTFLTLDREFSTRIWEINVDETEEQTKKILEYEDKEDSRVMKKILGKSNETSKQVLKAFIKMLPPIDEIIIPFELKDYFPTTTVRTRRDFKKFRQLVKQITYLHMAQRPRTEIRGKKILFATPQDAYYAVQIGRESLEATISRMEKRLKQALPIILRFQKESPNVDVTTANVANALGISQNYAYGILEGFVERGYLTKRKKGRENHYFPSTTFANALKSGIKRLDYLKLKKDAENFVTRRFEALKRYETNNVVYHPVTGEEVKLWD